MLRLGLIIGCVALLAQTGCDPEPYCINCNDNGQGIDGDGGAGGDGASPTPDAPVIDAGPPGDACINSGVEVCDDLDNDCDGEVDEGTLDGVGITCSTDTGLCVAGVTECVAGEIVCGGGAVLPVPELCDGMDNDCDGVDDNGDPEGGGVCGNNMGECVAGIERCIGGQIVCDGEVTGSPEVCDTKDNDCDGNFDEMLPPGGSCGPTQGNTGECSTGTEMCIGGVMQCVGAEYPTLEQCDALDHDCDGNDTNGFDLVNDARTCGSCTNDCTDDHTPAHHVAAVRCGTTGCEIAACEENYWDNDGTYNNGCEDFCDTFTGPQEACNDIDDDCDGLVDEDVIEPQACDENGMNCRDVCDLQGTACAGGTSVCNANGEWVCTGWPSYVETDANGNLVQETLCDDNDNDCDGVVDETYPNKNKPCSDGGVGICERTGTFECKATKDALECTNLSPVVPATTEVCNGLDDDCMGDVDEGFDDGSAQPWVDIGDGVEMLPYEASRPDADDTSAGALESHICSVPNALPWTGLTQPDAEAVCASINARLCTEDEWERACMVLRDNYQQGGAPDRLVVIEAEDYDSRTIVNMVDNGGVNSFDYRWNEQPFVGFSGSTAMWVWPNSDLQVTDNSGPRMSYDVEFTQTGTHYVWVRANDWQGGNFDDTIHVGLDGTISPSGNIVGRFASGWTWHNLNIDGSTRVTINVTSAGVHRLDIFMHDEAAVVDKIIVTTNSSYTPSGTGPTAACLWSYGSSCDTYQPDVCNGDDYDTTAGGDDDDEILPAGTMSACYADWGAAGKLYDMSGNVKEWVAERAPGQNPFRGGASNNSAGGISCKNDFGVVDDDFAFPNLGFRCCRDAP